MKSIPLFVFLPAIFSLCWSQPQAESASSLGADVVSLENEQPRVYTIELGHNDTMDVLERRILQLIKDEIVPPGEKRDFAPCHCLETKSINNEKIACFRFKLDTENLEEERTLIYRFSDKMLAMWWEIGRLAA